MDYLWQVTFVFGGGSSEFMDGCPACVFVSVIAGVYVDESEDLVCDAVDDCECHLGGPSRGCCVTVLPNQFGSDFGHDTRFVKIDGDGVFVTVGVDNCDGEDATASIDFIFLHGSRSCCSKLVKCS